jgi:hypothetical protein
VARPRIPDTTKVYVHNSRSRLQRGRGALDAYRKAQGLWLGSTHPKGYACRWVDGKRVTVHRELVGPLEVDQDAHHVCGNVRCVNPAHVEVLSRADHMRRHFGDRVALDDALELLAEHPRLTPAAIARMSGRPRKAVCAALRRAHRSGLVSRVGQGEYVLAEVAA